MSIDATKGDSSELESDGFLPPMISFAQNFEDVLLRRALSDIQTGFYVDIGAFDPLQDSVTAWFYKDGWSGVDVEPVPEFWQRLFVARPRDLVVQAAVTDSSDPVTLHLMDGLSSTVDHVAERNVNSGFGTDSTIKVDSMTLEDLFERHAGNLVVDFLKIDVEGAEAAVLASSSFRSVRPRLIVVEATLPNSRQTTHSEWEAGLLSKGYLFGCFDGLNRFYVRKEDSWRLDALKTPPCVFDNFQILQTDTRVRAVTRATGEPEDLKLSAFIESQHRLQWQRLQTERDSLKVELTALADRQKDCAQLLRVQNAKGNTDDPVSLLGSLADIGQELSAGIHAISRIEFRCNELKRHTGYQERTLDELNSGTSKTTGQNDSIDVDFGDLYVTIALLQIKQQSLETQLSDIRAQEDASAEASPDSMSGGEDSDYSDPCKGADLDYVGISAMKSEAIAHAINASDLRVVRPNIQVVPKTEIRTKTVLGEITRTGKRLGRSIKKRVIRIRGMW